MGVEVSVGIAGGSTGVREEASGEVIAEALLCILDRFVLFEDKKIVTVLLGMGRSHAFLLCLGYSDPGCAVPCNARKSCHSGNHKVHILLSLRAGILL